MNHYVYFKHFTKVNLTFFNNIQLQTLYYIQNCENDNKYPNPTDMTIDNIVV